MSHQSESSWETTSHQPLSRTVTGVQPTFYTPLKTQEKKSTPDSAWQDKSRAVLKACISADRGSLAPLNSGPEPYDASNHQLDFVHNHIINRRWNLEEVASKMRALLRLIRLRTRTTSAVVDQVRERDDDKCRLTGVEREKEGSEAEDQEARGVVTDMLQVVQCLPFKTGNTSFDLIEGLAGIKFTGWQADSVGNMFLTRPTIHEQFAAFKFFFEWIRTPKGEEIIIRGRTGPASPRTTLRGLLNDRGHRCDSILDNPLRPRHTGIADLDPKYFIVHKYIGDIVWMSGGTEPVSDGEEDDDDDVKVLSDTNIGAVIEKLHAPEMDMLPREREGIFRPRIQLVPKNSVWVN
ncbi:hypothetical protein GGX14DRAFT_565746 [Mycena pura]|uniref:Uncharacterized protein n=1 Tax=Mycena pura TaxID=153505 RepID=A0AAD6YAQ3_9AGAR|nr:hypothetical protein GGX14DRAFT_565746 [Mycena pura]